MNFKGRIAKLEQSMEARSTPRPFPFLLRDELAVFLSLRIDRIRHSKLIKCDHARESQWEQLRPEERQKYGDVLNQTIQEAKAIEADGRLREVLARLRAKGIDCD